MPRGDGGLKDCACWEWRGAGGLVFVVVLVVLVLIVLVPHVRHWGLHAGPAVVRVIRAGGHGTVGAAVTTGRAELNLNLFFL